MEFQALTAALVLVLATGTVVYSVVEGWSVLDALYFCVVTLATIGYGDFTPRTAFGKIFTIVYIVVGIGILAAFVNAIATRWLDRRLRRVGVDRRPPPVGTRRIVRRKRKV